jgi:hypothetical protein
VLITWRLVARTRGAFVVRSVSVAASLPASHRFSRRPRQSSCLFSTREREGGGYLWWRYTHLAGVQVAHEPNLWPVNCCLVLAAQTAKFYLKLGGSGLRRYGGGYGDYSACARHQA